jgi:hypothetical protein
MRSSNDMHLLFEQVAASKSIDFAVDVVQRASCKCYYRQNAA